MSRYFETNQSTQKTCDKFIVGESFSKFYNDTLCTHKLNVYTYSADTCILALFSDNKGNRSAWFITSGFRAIAERLYQEMIIKFNTLNNSK